MSCSKKNKNCVTINCISIGCVNKKLIQGNDDCFTLEFTEKIDDEISPINLSDFEKIEMDITDFQDMNYILMTKSLEDGLSIIGENTLKVSFNGNDFIGFDQPKVSYDILLTKNGIRKTYIEGTIFIRKVRTKRIL